MAGYRLAPASAKARRAVGWFPGKRRRLPTGFVATAAVIAGSSTATATATLSLTAPALVTGLSSNATAIGTLSLDMGSSGGERAAPGMFGWYVLESATASNPSISGGSTATSSASLTLQTPSAVLIAGISRATATGSLTLVAVNTSGLAVIVRPTSLSSAQFGSSSLSSAQFGQSSTTAITSSSVPS